jgi:hypothetical protein
MITLDIFELGDYEKCPDEIESEKEQEKIKQYLSLKTSIEFNKLQNNKE